MVKRLIVLIICFAAMNAGLPAAGASATVINEAIGKHFQGMTGTFIAYDQAEDTYIIYNEPQSNKRFTPCSTFKIYNSLIALETGVLPKEDAQTLLRWDGVQHMLPDWNRDHTLATATRDSVVWYFRIIANRIGQERMQSYLKQIAYGNQDMSGGLDRFWLESSLQISAKEQVDLLAKLYAGKLPFSPAVIAIVTKNITIYESDGVRFAGKTGSQYPSGGNVVGWFVGCVEKGGKRYLFATNIEAPNANGRKAREITKAILQDLKIL